ncbi:MAG: homoserine O-acetyltransferase [Crocinitomicaceae bacterium]|jgi:homoserine O-acetyltransferase
MYSTINKKEFVLEGGAIIENLTVGFHTYGKLNSKKDNVVWVCHALTANSNVFEWWSGLFGPGKQFNPDDYFIVCVNTLGSCYGTTGPASPRANQRPLLDEFPLVTPRDVARLFDAVKTSLEINSINTLIASSLGGQQALEWAILNPILIKNLILIATNARHSAYGIAFNESQRLAIYSDSTYGKGIEGGKNGLKTARSLALLSYRSYEIYDRSQTDDEYRVDEFKAASYQRYQGEKLANRFNAYAYVTLSKMMDSHNVGRGRGSIERALNQVSAKTLVVGITSDCLFPTREQRFIASHIRYSEYAEISSDYGHDGFLIETEKLAEMIRDFLHNGFKKNRPTVFKSTVKKSELMSRSLSGLVYK